MDLMYSYGAPLIEEYFTSGIIHLPLQISITMVTLQLSAEYLC